MIAPATDDRPFLYYKGGAIPAIYLWTLAGIMLITLLAVRLLGGSFRSMRPYVDLFFMGARSCCWKPRTSPPSRCCSAQRAGERARLRRGAGDRPGGRRDHPDISTPPLPVVWGAIVASLVMAYVIHPAWLLGWPFWPRLIVACVIGFLPVYLANIAFAKRFAATDHAQSAFAINLLGAILGGCLEYGALVTGYRNLLIVVGLLYLWRSC